MAVSIRKISDFHMFLEIPGHKLMLVTVFGRMSISNKPMPPTHSYQIMRRNNHNRS